MPNFVEEVVGRGARALGGLALLEPLHDLVDDRLRVDLALAESDVEVVGLAEPDLADHVDEQRRAAELLGRQPALAERLGELLAALPLGVLASLRLQEGADLVAGAAGPDEAEPVA